MRANREIWALVESCWHEPDKQQEERQERDIAKRIQHLCELYEGEDWAWREDKTTLERLAKFDVNHYQDRFNEILENYEKFIADRPFIERLRSEYPHIYNRTRQVFEYRIISIVEQYTPTVEEVKPKEDPKDIPARKARTQTLQGEIVAAQILAEFEAAKAFEAQFREANPDIDDEDEIHNEVEEFKRKLKQHQEEHKDKIEQQKETRRGRPPKIHRPPDIQG